MQFSVGTNFWNTMYMAGYDASEWKEKRSIPKTKQTMPIQFFFFLGGGGVKEVYYGICASRELPTLRHVVQTHRTRVEVCTCVEVCRFSAKHSFFGQSLSRGHYQPPEGVYLLNTIIISYAQFLNLGVKLAVSAENLKGLGHAILGNFSNDRMVIELTKISK